ncbi:ankyrin repeat and MYND domain-containing protein 1 [Perognathus longimembris pacificus]|uniref:ankyrin repeat and MYND domain-containing protein 1 n=1 Tax=Perognathus longimembris pacificus TaxID=214514 RepID=UPI00201974E9|nr:ankyrin repeat and MYND domain-containing protein 1 [Perognathus longimembris pacificus]
MDGGPTSVSLDREARPEGPEGPGGRPAAAKALEPLHGGAFLRGRDRPVTPGEEGEESEVPLQEEDLKRNYIELIQGMQEWQDGCVYRGEFGLDMKLGYGEFSWPTGEAYRGQFYRDHCHGMGTYMWPDGSSFTGMFYLSQREGYGTMYMKSRLFQGLYKADERFGPGFETYPDGCQDVGLWFREHLIKLCMDTPSTFSLLSYPEFSAFLTQSQERISLSQEEETVEWGPPEEQDPFFYEYKRLLLNDDLTLPPEMHIYSTDNQHLPMTGSLRKELDAQVFVNEIPPFVDDGEPWFIQNQTPLLIKIQKHTYRFRNKKAHSSWSMDAILQGNRSGFARRGPKELLSREMILRAEAGDRDWVYGILKDNLVCMDVADSKGYTVLAAAAVHSHHDIVSLLLDFGADVNKRSDEGLTPLSMCFLLYYPSKSFKPNIAERTMPQVSSPPPHPVAPNMSTLYSTETNFESSQCVHNYTIKLSKDILERSAKAYSMLQAPSFPDKGTVRKMAQSMLEHRSLWRTIQLLLCRGADPNLCSVPMQALFLAVKAGDVDGVRLLLESGARTDIQFPPQLRSLTPLHIAAALPGEEGVKITQLLLHAITNVDAKAADEDEVYNASKVDLLPSSLKLNNELGPPSWYYTAATVSVPEEGGRTALHVACEREDNRKCARDVVRLLLTHRANPNLLWSGHSPLSLSIASGNDLVVKELLSKGADPNLPLTRGLGNALCVICDLAYENQRSTDNKIALIDRLLNSGADILKPVTLTQGEKTAVGTVVDYGYFKFYQDRKIAHCPFHALMPAERETFLARKRLLEYMGMQLRLAVFAKEGQWDAREMYLAKRADMTPSHRLKKKSLPKSLSVEKKDPLPFFKFCYQCGRSVGVRLTPCTRCYGMLTCSKYCKTRAWTEFHRKDCGELSAMWKMCGPQIPRRRKHRQAASRRLRF